MSNAISYFEDLMQQATGAMREIGLPSQQMVPGTSPLATPVVQDTLLGLPTGELQSLYRQPPPEAPGSMAGLDEWLRARERQNMMRGIGETVDQLGSAFDQRLTNIAIPASNTAVWRPNVNPGIAGMVQQLLLAGRR